MERYSESSDPEPPMRREIVVSEKTTVGELAALLLQTRAQIVADLMKLNIFLTIDQTPDFETISIIAQKYGYVAKRAV